MEIVLYTTNCPKCCVLEKKLSASGIEFETVDNVDVMQKKGFLSAPMLEVNGKALDFKEAIDWVNGGGKL